MVDIQKIIEQGIEKKATDIHLIAESKPIFRIGNVLVKMQTADIMKKDDLNEIHSYL